MSNEIQINKKEVKSIFTKSNLPVGDYSINPYIGCLHACKYCYATFMKRFTKHDEKWGEFLDIKYWPKIRNPNKYDGKSIFIGSVTDPYQKAEEKYERTKSLLEQLEGVNVEISIATKSDLVLRDLDLIKSFPNSRVSWSINTLDDTFQQDMDKAVSISRRIKAMKKFHKEGVRTTCFISPIFPEITDIPSIIEKTRKYCNLIWLENLNLRGDYKKVILNYIKQNYPQYEELYQQIYNKKDKSYWVKLDNQIKQYCRKEDLLYLINDDSIKRPFNDNPIVVNYFYHEKIKKSSRKNNSN